MRTWNSGISRSGVSRNASHRNGVTPSRWSILFLQQEVSCEFFVVASVCVLLSAPAFAQRGTPPPPTDRTKLSYMSAAEVDAAIAKLPPDRANSAVPVFTLLRTT